MSLGSDGRARAKEVEAGERRRDRESVWREAVAESRHGRPAAPCRPTSPRGRGLVPFIRVVSTHRSGRTENRPTQGCYPQQDL